MGFKTRKLTKKVASQPCLWCGWLSGKRHAALIIEEGPDVEWNMLSLCPNCATIFDEVVRPRFYKALKKFGSKNLPGSWSKDKKRLAQAVTMKMRRMRLSR